MSEHADMNVKECVRACVRTFLCLFTFVVGGVIDCEISIPDDGQLHG